jgi:hypothetical protein
MAGRHKFYELLDIPRFAHPNVLELQARPTAANLTERTGGGGFMSYGQIWPRVPWMVRGFATDAYIESEFSSYKDDWKNEAIRDAFRLLRDKFGGKGNWRRASNIPINVLGCWFKTSIKGFWVYGGKIYAVLVNCRKDQSLSYGDVRFLARGVYELHCIDDPNNPIPLIVDLSQHAEDDKRKARFYEVPIEEAVSIEAFEYSVREFLVASNMAGISQPLPDTVEHVLDLFRR